MQCKTCRHYHFYKKIRSSYALFAYTAEIPCRNCKHFSLNDDNYEPASIKPVQAEFDVDEKAELKSCVKCASYRTGNFCNICGNILNSALFNF